MGYLAIVAALFAIELHSSFLAICAFTLGAMAMLHDCFK